MTRFRVTVRGDGAELRGYITLHSSAQLNEFATIMTPVGLVAVSEAPHDYDPFRAPWNDTKHSPSHTVYQMKPDGPIVCVIAGCELYYRDISQPEQESSDVESASQPRAE